jgi:hypothetical protein
MGSKGHIRIWSGDAGASSAAAARAGQNGSSKLAGSVQEHDGESHLMVKSEPWRRWSCSGGWPARECRSEEVSLGNSPGELAYILIAGGGGQRTVDVLRQAEEVGVLPRQGGQGVVARVGLGL